jgi:hypothetical protein
VLLEVRDTHHYGTMGIERKYRNASLGAPILRRSDARYAERLATSDSRNAEWYRDIAMSFGTPLLARKHSGDRAKARDFLRQDQAIMSRLTKLSPDNATWKQDLAELNQKIAELAER